MYGSVTSVEIVLNLDGHGVFARQPDGNLTFFNGSHLKCDSGYGKCGATLDASGLMLKNVISKKYFT